MRCELEKLKYMNFNLTNIMLGVMFVYMLDGL